MQYPSWASIDAFSAGQASRIFDILPRPGMQANIDPDGAVKRADSTLDTTLWFRDDMPGDHCLQVMRLTAQSVLHISDYSSWEGNNYFGNKLLFKKQ
jgi:hypothetical protein